MMADHTGQLNKWRLLLGKYAKEHISFEGADLHYMDMEELLDYLYEREYGEDSGVRKEGGSGDSNLTVSDWLNKIRELFPKETVEILERHALENYGMSELLTDKEVLEKLEPNRELLKTILQLKSLMKGEVLETARRIVKKVADELMKKLEQDMKKSLLGRLDRSKASHVPSIRNLDIKKTISANLKNYDMESKQLVLKRIYFNSRVKKYHTWRIILAVDESGSMLDSVIHSAVMAGIFARLPMLDTRLVIFDTNVVDLSGYIEDPVETLMSVQLGGGTDIAGALAYCEGLIDNPSRTMVVLISDLYEGGGYQRLYSVGKGIIEAGAKLIALTSLDMEANPNYDRNAAAHLASLGAHVAAMTPEGLADWVGRIIG
ncbi:VWA domain-containing protein [Anaerocolumna xylanovorans]|uniref:VWA domain containing CoxE-like protein n=1 Tax=Anaerocolumna xylanovorans DSM 12503 TaxID=1121345 RepID=A0A1M7XYF3_9FIRM|nr:VWA domain-containing protein [Anaerocolumna xylanovorans]SHO44077.1 VWA domain containing CoxE-like protein [Anaerocolumna xylanovorans DSM 12503]